MNFAIYSTGLTITTICIATFGVVPLLAWAGIWIGILGFVRELKS